MKLMNLFKEVHHLSYSKKIKFFMFLVTVGLFLITILINIIFWHLLSDRDFEKSESELFYITTEISNSLESPKNMAYKLIGDDYFQELMVASNQDNLSNTDKYMSGRNLKELVRNTSMSERNIASVYLISEKNESLGSVLTNSNQILPNLSLDDILQNFPNTPSPGKWFFSTEINQAVFAQKIFNTHDLSLNYLGTIIILLDTTFIKTKLQNSLNFTDDNIFLMNYDGQLYPTTFSNDAEIQDISSSFSQKNLLHFNQKRIDSQKGTYYISSTVSNDSNFSFAYLIPVKVILSSLIRIEVIFAFLILLFILPLLQAINRISKRITEPIILLANNMNNLQNETDIIQLKNASDISENSNDEVAKLYDGFRNMLTRIDHLIDDNYKIKILSQEIEFQALQAQLDPHFLYNTLDSIYWLALENNESKIAEMAQSLALLFRKKIDNTSAIVTLDDELKLVDAYTKIQLIRFEHRVTFTKNIRMDNLDIQVPKFIIQPLIENSFKHAVEKSNNQVDISLNISVKNQFLFISVTDTGPGFSSPYLDFQKNGIGLNNIKERLRIFYGPESSLTITSESKIETKVQLKMPIKFKEKGEIND
ncbi:sensor histidine kinase [Enterococcus timonensis]|uniref:sensor histidine kinase n=1 Tax=Enterococcus timonensis TaxID=1852364 RepID=UPI0008DB0FCD|nr:histidine kinase [Enterococcus timonensis]